MQIDVKKIGTDGIVTCNLYTGERCVKVFMSLEDYNVLNDDGFFIRSGMVADSANVWNTTAVYKPLKM